MGKDWLLPARETEGTEGLIRAMGVTPVTAHLLARRGLTDPDEARGFLEPSLANLCPPAGLPGVEAGAARLEAAVEGRERILVFGDYDVDGTTGAAVLQQILTALGGDVEVHIPDREEGYGLGKPRMERAADEGIKLVISVDNGISALEEAAFLAERGVDLVVADHHEFGDELPVAAALVHPRLPGSDYANRDLCGAGVAFKLAWALAARMGSGGRPTARIREELLRCLGLVALGTVADVVSLTGENRILVRYGLRSLAVGGSAGIAELLRISRVEGEPSATDVAFRLAPRLNAAGRMGRAGRAFDLLTATDEADAKALAEELDKENTRRRSVQDRVFQEARQQVEDVYGEDVPAAGIVVWGQAWPHGIVGIVAAKLTEAFDRPALVVSVEGEQAKGSGRSVAEVDLLVSLESSRDLFLRLGGHAAAVGFTVDTETLPQIREAFSAGVRGHLGLEEGAGLSELRARLGGYEVVADVEVRLDEISRDLLDELERLSPFGQGNPEPLFAARDVELAGRPRLMGAAGNHVSFHLRQGDRVIRTVAWGRRDLWETLEERARPGPAGRRSFEVAFLPRLNRWNGEAKVELELKAIRFDGPEDVAE